jgi:large subunit ribosomal protein L31
MKKDIHPEYKESQVTCGCGNAFTTRSTREKIAVEVCSNCHPFYTGKQKFVDTAGMVEKFQRKWKGEAAQKAQAIANPPPKKTAAQRLQAARTQQTIAAALGAPKTAAPAPAAPAPAAPAKAPAESPAKKA